MFMRRRDVEAWFAEIMPGLTEDQARKKEPSPKPQALTMLSLIDPSLSSVV
jgi:hypothetical protein